MRLGLLSRKCRQTRTEQAARLRLNKLTMMSRRRRRPALRSPPPRLVPTPSPTARLPQVSTCPSLAPLLQVLEGSQNLRRTHIPLEALPSVPPPPRRPPRALTVARLQSAQMLPPTARLAAGLSQKLAQVLVCAKPVAPARPRPRPPRSPAVARRLCAPPTRKSPPTPVPLAVRAPTTRRAMMLLVPTPRATSFLARAPSR